MIKFASNKLFRMKKKYIILITITLALCFFAYQYIYHEKRNIETEKPNFSLKVIDLENDLKSGDVLFNKKYLDKTIEVTGVISEIEINNNAILVDDKIFATLSTKPNADLKVKDNITIKARFIGYDDLLEKFRFDQATIVK